MNSTDDARPQVAQQDISALGKRLYFMDNLRALAMMAGVVFHASLAHSIMLQNIWPSANAERSSIVDMLAWFPHVFRMPLFFLIAGFFAALIVNKRGIGGLLKNRALRILLPLVIFLPLCMWAVISSLLHAAGSVEHKSAVLSMVAYAMANPGSPPPPPTTMHLWFLYNLVFFYILTWVFYLFDGLRVRNFFSQLSPWIFILALSLLVFPALISQSAPFPAPDSFLPQLWSFRFFGLFFMVGYWVYSEPDFIDKFQPHWMLMLVLSIALYALFYWLIPKEVSVVPAPVEMWKKIIITACESFIAIAMTLVCLVLGKTYLNTHNPFMRISSDSSYWIYIIHVPLLFAIQYQLMDKSWNLFAKLGIALGLTLIIGLASYFLLVRWTPIGWMLNGKRKKNDVK
ncbi:acyltransferase family protein [Cellvibrio sp.]|uniref:acyltransferase family protein n=1 Tax=Cellvibrio sp. TaxID=1965322 RepID=UPI0039647E18